MGIGRPRGSGARYVRVHFRDQGSYHLYIGRALWHELGSPARVRVRRDRGRAPTLLYLLPAEGQAGYRVTQAPAPGLGMPKISMGRGVALGLGLLPGRFAATIEGAAIVADLGRPVQKGYRNV